MSYTTPDELRALADAGDYNTAPQLRAAADRIEALEGQTWGEWNRGRCDAFVDCPTASTLKKNSKGWEQRALAAEAERVTAVALLRRLVSHRGVLRYDDAEDTRAFLARQEAEG